MGDDPGGLILAVGLSRATGRIVRQKLRVRLGMVAIQKPATPFGL